MIPAAPEAERELPLGRARSAWKARGERIRGAPKRAEIARKEDRGGLESVRKAREARGTCDKTGFS